MGVDLERPAPAMPEQPYLGRGVPPGFAGFTGFAMAKVVFICKPGALLVQK